MTVFLLQYTTVEFELVQVLQTRYSAEIIILVARTALGVLTIFFQRLPSSRKATQSSQGMPLLCRSEPKPRTAFACGVLCEPGHPELSLRPLGMGEGETQ